MITIVAKCVLKPGKKQEFIAGVRDMIAGSRNEPGNISYTLCEDMDSENTVAFLEQWKDEAAIDEHNASAHFAAGLKVIQALSDDVEIIKYRAL